MLEETRRQTPLRRSGENCSDERDLADPAGFLKARGRSESAPTRNTSFRVRAWLSVAP
jgi:hypothetical protein